MVVLTLQIRHINRQLLQILIQLFLQRQLRALVLAQVVVQLVFHVRKHRLGLVHVHFLVDLLADLVDVSVVGLRLHGRHQLRPQTLQFLILFFTYPLQLRLQILKLILQLEFADVILKSSELLLAAPSHGLDFEFIGFVVDGLHYLLEVDQVDLLVQDLHHPSEVVDVGLLGDLIVQVRFIDFAVQGLGD